MSGNSQIGRILAAAGAAVMIIGLFLPWAEGFGDDSDTAWALEKADVVILVLGILILIAAALALAGAVRLPLLLVAAFAAFAGGLAAVFPLEGATGLKAGFWITLIGATLSLIGAIIGDLGDRALAPGAAGAGADPGRGPGGAPGGAPPPAPQQQRAAAPPPAQPAAAPPPAAPAQPAPAQQAQAATPAGWYADPRGEARLRYWDGNAWTSQTSG